MQNIDIQFEAELAIIQARWDYNETFFEEFVKDLKNRMLQLFDDIQHQYKNDIKQHFSYYYNKIQEEKENIKSIFELDNNQKEHDLWSESSIKNKISTFSKS